MGEPVDHFAALGLERAAALDEAQVRERFHELSREAHPDTHGGDGEAFAAINEAQRVLSSPSARLRHLLELQFGTRPAAAVISDSLMDLFAGVGGAISAADAVIAKVAAATTAVAKALLAPQELAAQQSLMEAGGQLVTRRREIEDRLEALSVDDRDALLEAWHELAFLEKWQRQVQGRMGQLI